MPRRARIQSPGIPLHLIQRGHYRQQCFYTNGDYLYFLGLLRKFGELMEVAVHAYVLMTNHLHILASFSPAALPGEYMKAVLQAYTQYLNRRLGRSGTLWEGRYRSCPVPVERYLMTCHHYIELNPVRAGMVETVAEYPWSSYRANAGLAEDSAISPHCLYTALGATAIARGEAYQARFAPPSDVDLAELRRATRSNTLPGSPIVKCGRPAKGR
ncbi:transposase [Pseudoduganella lutea]|nr:transposase [Pseudoduganella lutea]